MIRHLGLQVAWRLSASAFTLGAVLQPHAGHTQTVAVPAATVLPHISITTMGKGSPVVLIPGLSSPRATWDGIAPRIARDHRVILVEVNGFGGSAPGANLQPGLLDGVVADLTAYLTAQRLTKVDVIGHSMGGLLALMMAHAHPDRVGKLMIVDSLPFIGLLFSPAATVPLVEPQAKAMRDQMAATFGKPADPAIADATANRLALKPDSRAKVKTWMEASDPRVTAAALYEDMTTDLRADLPRIAAPITLVYPVTADGSSKPMAEAMYRGAYAGAPHVTFVDVKDSAHFVMLDQPVAFAAAVDAFLAK